MFEVSWTDLKDFLTSRGAGLQYIEFSEYYILCAFNEHFHVTTTISKLVSSSDRTDFETNYLSSANQALTSRVELSNALPAGTNAIGKLAANSGVDIGDVTINNSTGASAVNVQDGGNSLTVDGTVGLLVASAASLSNVNDQATNTTLLNSNSGRRGVIVFNDSTANAFLKYGVTASSTSFTVKIPAGGYWEMPQPIYTGQIDVIWDSDQSGAARVTELT